MSAGAATTSVSADLRLDRFIDAPAELVWEAWTTPEHVKEWFAPAPFTITQCEIDLRPGGMFRTVIHGPLGERSVNDGCYLEVVERERLVWTTALGGDYRPQRPGVGCPALPFTAVITLTTTKGGTDYSVVVMHDDAAAAERHVELGFFGGWSSALDQLVAVLARRTGVSPVAETPGSASSRGASVLSTQSHASNNEQPTQKGASE